MLACEVFSLIAAALCRDRRRNHNMLLVSSVSADLCVCACENSRLKDKVITVDDVSGWGFLASSLGLIMNRSVHD